MQVLICVLMVSALVVVDARRMPAKQRGHRGGQARHAGVHERGERVWHLAESQAQCGDSNATLYQHYIKPHDLCTEVNTKINDMK